MASLQNNYSLCGRSLSWKMGSERTPCQNQKVDLGFPNPGVMLIDLDKSVNLFLVFTHVTSTLTTVAIRHVGAQTNALS